MKSATYTIAAALLATAPAHANDYADAARVIGKQVVSIQATLDTMGGALVKRTGISCGGDDPAMCADSIDFQTQHGTEGSITIDTKPEHFEVHLAASYKLSGSDRAFLNLLYANKSGDESKRFEKGLNGCLDSIVSFGNDDTGLLLGYRKLMSSDKKSDLACQYAHGDLFIYIESFDEALDPEYADEPE